MEWNNYSTDSLEQQLLSNQELVSRVEAQQLLILEELDRRQVATGDGSRSMSEWVAARLDVGPDRAKSLVRTMRRTADRADLRDHLAEGVSFDRVEALSRISEDVGLWLGMDVATVRREAARQARWSTVGEPRTADDRFLVVQPSLDESWWKVWGGLDGHAGAIVDKVLTELADELPDLPDGSSGDLGWRRATALFELCLSDEAPPANVSVFVDATHAGPANGDAGVVLEAGPGVGLDALQAILCDANPELIVRTEDGRYMDYGRRKRTAPPSLRRALMDRWGHRCAADGCESRYRLEVHHLTPWSQGGRTDQDETILFCWYHHHVVVHERGFEVFKHPDHGRIRFRHPNTIQGRSP